MDSGQSNLEKLINQCRSNDVDVKVDAFTKLQREFECGDIETIDVEAILQIVKTCLRTSNQHLTNAILSALPPLLPLLISRHIQVSGALQTGHFPSTSSTSSIAAAGITDVVVLRQVLMSLLPAGGIIDRLGDKERAQVKARESLVTLGGFAFRSTTTSTTSSRLRDGKGPETPLAMFERFLKEGGFASKVWKVREQSIMTLVHLRRVHHLFPIRPYLSHLVDCLEDTDAHVRECARQSILELFSGPAVTDAARADLKKEMTKKGVRKTIVDGVLSKLLGSSSVGSEPQSQEGSENGDTGIKPKGYIPPSLALQDKRPKSSQTSFPARTISQSSVKELSRPSSRAAMVSPTLPAATETTDVQPIFIASSRDLETEFAQMAKAFDGKETEHNWASREQSIMRVRGMIKGEIHQRYVEVFFTCLKDGFIQWSLKTLASLRTTVAINTCALYSDMFMTLGPSMDPFVDILLPNLLKMAGFTKKITAQQSQSSVSMVIAYTSAQPRTILTLLWSTFQEKTVQARAYVVSHLKQYIEIHGQRSKHLIENSGGLEILEKSVKKALADANPAVKETARVLFWVFEEVWRERGLVIMNTLDTTARKQLLKACPKTDVDVSIPTTPNVTKKSSVSAAIAASRAKARAIATAPPTLRHQATSSSYAPSRSISSSNTSPTTSKNYSIRPASPLRISTSPPSPSRSRISDIARSVGTARIPSSHYRTPSGGSMRAASPSFSDKSYRRNPSSPLGPLRTTSDQTETIRKAIQAALPASVSNSVEQFRQDPRDIYSARSALASQIADGVEESLLLAQTVPLPDDTDSEEDDRSVNLLSFSTPLEKRSPNFSASHTKPVSSSIESGSSRPSVSNALSSGSIGDSVSSQPIVEDALRARAEQAESAAERLLELVEPEDDNTLEQSLLPASLFVGHNGNGLSNKHKPFISPKSQKEAVILTPMNRGAAILRQASLFKDSPAYTKRSTSLLDILQGRKNESGWWLKRSELFAESSLLPASKEGLSQLLENCITGLLSGDTAITDLKSLALLCKENPVEGSSSTPSSPVGADPMSPSPFDSSRPLPCLESSLWEVNKSFERLFSTLVTYLVPAKSEEELEYGLIVVWEMLENQATYLEGKESDLFSMLLRVRYCNKIDVLQATNAIRDALTSKLEPVYGLTTMHASLRSFCAEAPPIETLEDIKAATYAFGLIALGKFIARLPAEIAEEELPRLKTTLISSLNDKTSLIVRESAAASIIAAQLVLRDETHLFALLDGLADEKKNLLAYLFDKHGVRGLSDTNGLSGIDKLEKEIRRLDMRTSTPLKLARGSF